jgi:hypothetical protein
MKLPTLILSHRYSSDSNALFSAVNSVGWDVERLHSFYCPDSLKEKEIIFYGETILADAICNDLNLALFEPNYDWLPNLPYQYRLRTIELTSFQEVCNNLFPKFIKPVDEKWFPAKVYFSTKELKSDYSGSDDLQILISEPVIFETEFRFFIANRKIYSFSPYIKNGQLAKDNEGNWICEPNESQEATDFISKLLTDQRVDLPPAVVIDVGKIKDFGWAVVEANPIWASGLCGANPVSVLQALYFSSQQINKVSSENKKWIRNHDQK